MTRPTDSPQEPHRAQVPVLDLTAAQACDIKANIRQSTPHYAVDITYCTAPDWQCHDWELEIFYETKFRTIPAIQELLYAVHRIRNFAALTGDQLENLSDITVRSGRLGEPELLPDGEPADPASFFVQTPTQPATDETPAGGDQPGPQQASVRRGRAKVETLIKEYQAGAANNNILDTDPGWQKAVTAYELTMLLDSGVSAEAGAVLLQAAIMLYDAANARHEHIVNASA